jgi:hypothetical protein
MQKIPLLLAEPDMVLARDILRDDNASGPPICGRGVTLTDALIERLKRMDVQTITVEGHPVRMDGDRSPEDILLALDTRFRKFENDPLTNKLKKIYRAHYMKSFGDQGGREAS